MTKEFTYSIILKFYFQKSENTLNSTIQHLETNSDVLFSVNMSLFNVNINEYTKENYALVV